MGGSLRVWLQAARPKTLTAAVSPILVGTTLAHAAGFGALWPLAAFALLSTLFIQIGTNLANDVLDFKKGADNSERIGPARVTVSGLLSERQVMAGAVVAFGLAALFGLPLVLQAGLAIVGIGLVSIACGYLYTGGPAPLAYVGLGDVFVLIFFGIVAVEGTYWLHARELGVWPLLAGIEVGLLSVALIAINNLRDRRQDAKTGKRTLAVRFGPGFAQTEIIICLVLPFILNLAWLRPGWHWAALLPLGALPIALRLAVRVGKMSSESECLHFLPQAALVHLLFGALLAVGLLGA